MISRTIGFVGLLASAMALSSLIYGAFQEPVGPYMEGIIGGVMDVYRTMRDLLFAGLGWTFSGLINWAGQWLSWLPPAPWFFLPPLWHDVLSIYIIGGVAFWKFFYAMAILAPVYRYKTEMCISWVRAILVPRNFWHIFSQGLLYLLLFPFWSLFVANMISWEIKRPKGSNRNRSWGAYDVDDDDSERLQAPPESSFLLKIIGSGMLYEIAIRTRQILKRTTLNLLYILTGTFLFFVLVYAENQIGL